MKQKMKEDYVGDPPVREAASSGNEMLLDSSAKHARFDSCFSFKEINVDSGIKSLKHLDSKKFKDEIRRWAKRVVSYARQVSDRYGSSRR